MPGLTTPIANCHMSSGDNTTSPLFVWGTLGQHCGFRASWLPIHFDVDMSHVFWNVSDAFWCLKGNHLDTSRFGSPHPRKKNRNKGRLQTFRPSRCVCFFWEPLLFAVLQGTQKEISQFWWGLQERQTRLTTYQLLFGFLPGPQASAAARGGEVR